MPKAMEDALKRRAAKMGLDKERTGRFVYGTMRKHGWKPGQSNSSPVRRGRNPNPGTPRGSVNEGTPGYKGEGETSSAVKKFGQYNRRIKKRVPPSPRGTQSAGEES